MSKLIYDEPVKRDGKVIVSTEILTHFRCEQCGKWSTASDVENLPPTSSAVVIVYCVYCGEKIGLPRHGTDEFSEAVIKSFETDPDEKHFIAPELMAK